MLTDGGKLIGVHFGLRLIYLIAVRFVFEPERFFVLFAYWGFFGHPLVFGLLGRLMKIERTATILGFMALICLEALFARQWGSHNPFVVPTLIFGTICVGIAWWAFDRWGMKRIPHV